MILLKSIQNASGERIGKLIAKMEEEALDGILITDPRHVYYFSGFASNPHERFLGLALVRGEEPFLLVPELDREAAEAATQIKIYTHQDTDDPYLLLKLHFPGNLRKLGIEKNVLTVSQLERLLAAVCPEEGVIDVHPWLSAMRMIKSEEEVDRIISSIQLVERVLKLGLRQVKAGVTELELVAELEYQMKKLGADGPSFSTLVLAGDNSALPHGKPGSRTVSEGGLLLFDLGVYANGYASDLTRTFAVGEINDTLAGIYDTVLQANRLAIKAVRHGAIMADVDAAARDYIEVSGYGPRFVHRLGHGLGLDVHEYPSIHGSNQDTLQAGMVITVEPGIYVPGTGGVRIEDDVLVTPEGARVLTSFPKELTVIG